MPTLERARAKLNELVAHLARLNDKKDKTLDALIRVEARRVKQIRAITRQQKRLEKLQAAAVYTNGPTATAVEPLVEAVATKPTPAPKLNDEVPSLAKDSVPLEDLAKTPEGKANAASWGAIPAVAKAKRKARRSPDDFKADMANKKSATDGVDGR